MISETKKQIYELIKKSANPLILIPGRSNLDMASGALGLFLMFKKLNKSPQIVSLAPLSDKFLFLPEAKSIGGNISNEAVFKVAVNVAKNDLKQVSYDQENDLLNIYLTVKKGKIKIDSAMLDGVKFKYDLIIVLGFQNLNSLGRIYFENRDIFSNVPIVNIDYSAANERFGAVNLTEATPADMALTIAEIIKDILLSEIDAKTATLLLASVISVTDNFQAPRIHSKLFALAASLIDRGAEREEIIKHLYEFKTGTNLSAVATNIAATNIPGAILKKKSDMRPGRISG